MRANSGEVGEQDNLPRSARISARKHPLVSCEHKPQTPGVGEVLSPGLCSIPALQQGLRLRGAGRTGPQCPAPALLVARTVGTLFRFVICYIPPATSCLEEHVAHRRCSKITGEKEGRVKERQSQGKREEERQGVTHGTMLLRMEAGALQPNPSTLESATLRPFSLLPRPLARLPRAPGAWRQVARGRQPGKAVA